MKKVSLFTFFLISFAAISFSQQINPIDLIGTWDQTTGKNPATILFIDSSRVRYSYKGHTGSAGNYYYLLNTVNTPAVLTVDYSKKHKKHRNEYLIQFVNKDTIKLQVLYKKDSRDHFADEPKDKTVLLARRKAV
jgi:hypothetical protein